MRNLVKGTCADVFRMGLSAATNSYALVLLFVFLAVVPAEAQQVNERMRSTFAQAEMLYRTAEPDQAIQPLTILRRGVHGGSGGTGAGGGTNDNLRDQPVPAVETP